MNFEMYIDAWHCSGVKSPTTSGMLLITDLRSVTSTSTLSLGKPSESKYALSSVEIVSTAVEIF